MSNPMQDEADAFFGAIDSPNQQDTSTATAPAATSPFATLRPNSTTDASTPQGHQSPQPTLDTSTTLPSVASLPEHLRLQPGMSPAIQKGSVSLGLALGGSGFRRKPLFGPDEDDDEDDNGLGFAGEQAHAADLISPENRRAGKSRRKNSKDATFRELTRSDFDGDETRTDEANEEGEDDEDDFLDEDADSETPLQPQEPIRGLQ